MLDVLVHCPDFNALGAGPRYAANLAASLGAALTGLYVAPRIPALPPPAAPPSLAREFLGFVHDEVEQARHALGTFGRLAGSAGVRDWQWQLAIGNPGEALVAAGNWNDLLVLERRDHAPADTADLIAEVVESGVPCIVIRATETALAEPRRIVLAWNGSVQALRALHSALPILRRARQIHLLVSPVPVHSSSIVCEPEFSPERYLKLHGCPAQVTVLPPGQRPAEEAILNAAATLGADLLVMGAYGRKPPLQRPTRGATDFLLEQAPLPLFLRH